MGHQNTKRPRKQKLRGLLFLKLQINCQTYHAVDLQSLELYRIVECMHLDEVTLCCVDNRYPELGFKAIERTCKELGFAEVLFFTNAEFVTPQHEIKNLKIIPLLHIKNIDDYSRFMLKELNQYVHTSHVLTIQWDGYVIHPESWQQEFLNWDYIGAPWPRESGLIVGNGGFSFRSKKLLEALQDERILPNHPEDNCICLDNRALLEREYGIQFAPPELAAQFAYEFAPPVDKPFGFHGFFHFPKLLNDDDLTDFIKAIPEGSVLGPYLKIFTQVIKKNSSRRVNEVLYQKLMSIIQSSDTIVKSENAFGFLRGLLKSGQVSLAYALFKRRMQLVGLDMKFFKLIFRFIPGILNNIGYKLMRFIQKSA